MTRELLQSPCESCPYRRSVRLAFWSIEEYRKLEANDAEPFGAMFDCHGESKIPKGERRPCVGWLLDQRRRGVPSLLLRLRLGLTVEFGAYFDKLKDLGKRVLYSSIAEMFEANYPGRRSRPMQPKRKTP